MLTFWITHLARRPWLALWGLVMLTVVALFGATRLRLDASNERLFIRASADYRVYQDFLTTFGSDETVLLALHDSAQHLLTSRGLAAIRALTEDLSALPHVLAVSSLTQARDMTRFTFTDSGMSAPPLIARDNLSAEEIAVIRNQDWVVGTLLSADLHSAGFLVVPTPNMTPAEQQAWINAIRTTAGSLKREYNPRRRGYVKHSPCGRPKPLTSV
ncbi:MAG: hypothetical protein O7G88_04490 [bacterium]|nr:hypothetical protein [bacterium]